MSRGAAARDRLLTLGFVAASFGLAFLQRPGWATSDTKVDLHVDPSGFLSEVAAVWAPSIDLGAVQGAQYSGYLWPMGPLFALLHGLGLSAWAAHRVWLGLMFALSAWGMLKLLDAFLGRPRGLSQVLGAGFYLLNPYTVIFSGRTSVVLLGYAALPWLLLVAHGGVRAVRAAPGWRDWRGWWGAAAFALIVTSTGGGVNAAVVGWLLVGPLVLLVYEPLVGRVAWRDAGVFLARAAVLAAVVSLWWIAPLLVHVGYGVDFLQFTEQPRAIWGTNSAPEALRLMAYWTSYIGVGFYGARLPLYSEAGTLLFDPLVVGASLLVPAIAVAGFALMRRHRYAPFFLLLLLVGVVIEVAGFPNGTPAREGMEWVYRNVSPLRFLRTTQKAAPLVAAGVAGLLALFTQFALARLRAARGGGVRRAGGIAVAAALAALILVAALPLVRGDAVERQLTWKKIPAAWERAGRDLDSELPAGSRALVLPGQIFAHYRWGGTIDAILPRLTERPVAVRFETPYSDPRANDLLWTVDRLVQQRRLVPGQLAPLVRLMGAGAVVSGSDDDTARSGGMNAAEAAEVLAGQGLGEPDRSYGPSRRVARPSRELGAAAALPQVRRYDVPGGRGLVSVAPVERPVVVDGSAEGLAAMAAFGALPERDAILYAGDLGAAQLRRIASRGADVVVTDSNRRRRFVPEYGHQNLGGTLTEDEELDENFALIEPFPERGADAQTVTTLRGAHYVRAPNEGGLLEFPEYGAAAAFDGDLSTVWAADRYLDPSERWIEIGFERPRDVPYVDLYPLRDWRGIEREVEVGDVRARLQPGRNRVRLGLEDVSRLRVTITRVDQPPGDLRGSGGFREIAIPGVTVTSALRPPVLAGRALAASDVSRVGLSYVFERTTADAPFRRDRQTGSRLLELASNRRDPEDELERLLFTPVERAYDVEAWVYPAVDARDPELDRLTGTRGSRTLDSSGRFHNEPRYRASAAFDGDRETAWMGIWARPSAPYPWISWSTPRAHALSRLTLEPASGGARRPTVVRLSWPGGATAALRVAPGGHVDLRRTVRARKLRLTVLQTEPAPGQRGTRAVGIASVRAPGMGGGLGSEARAGMPLRTRCGDARVRVGGRVVPLRPAGTAADLEAGRPLRARACSRDVPMAAGVQRVASLPATFAVHLLRLDSPAPEPAPAPAAAGRVVDPGKLRGSSVEGVRVRLDRPAWLVLGQSYSDGWRASCDGTDLGAPRPVNAYANGWRAPPDCERVEFRFAPQSLVRAGYWVAGIGAGLLALFVLAAPLLARAGAVAPGFDALRPIETPPTEAVLPEERPVGYSLRRAVLIALVMTVPLALLFALRTSVVVFPLLTWVLWRGVPSPRLALIAAAILGVLVPVLYAVTSPRDRGGFNFEYSTELIWAHWAGVTAIVILMAACWRALAAARRRE